MRIFFFAYYSFLFWLWFSSSWSNPSDLDELGDIESKIPFSSESPAEGVGEFILRNGEVDAIVDDELGFFKEDGEIGEPIGWDAKDEFDEFTSTDPSAADITDIADIWGDACDKFLARAWFVAAAWRDECKFWDADELGLVFEGFAESGWANEEFDNIDGFVSVMRGGGLFESLGLGGSGVDFIRGIAAGFIIFWGVKVDVEIRSDKLERAAADGNGLGNGGACFLTYSFNKCKVYGWQWRKSHWVIPDALAYSGS